MTEKTITVQVDEERYHRALTIEEMQRLLERQQEYERACMGQDADSEQVEVSALERDAISGLLDSSYFYSYEPELLRTHLLVEQCFEQFDEVDWASLTNGYDEMILWYIEYTYVHPLMWLELPPDNGSCVIDGRVAIVGWEKERAESEECMNFMSTMHKKRLAWFAENLPKRGDVITPEGDNILESMPLWYLITTDFNQSNYSPICPKWVRDELYEKLSEEEKKEAMAKGLFSRDALLVNLQYIASECGAESAIRLIENLRGDWQKIDSLCLYGINLIGKESKEQFANFLNKGLDFYIQQWRADEQLEHETRHRQEDPDSSFFRIGKDATYEMCRDELLTTLRTAKSKAKACRILQSSNKETFFTLNDLTDERKAECVNPWLKHVNNPHISSNFTEDDFCNARK